MGNTNTKVLNEKMKSYADAANPKVWNEKMKSYTNAKVFNEKMKTYGESSVTRVNKEDGKKFELLNVLDVTHLSIFGYYLLTLKVKDPEDGGKCKIFNTKASASDDVRGRVIHTNGFKYVSDCPCGDMYSKFSSLIEGLKGEGEGGIKGEGGSTDKQMVKKFMGKFSF
ncbi:hypothetical protein ACHQM5_022280 [Ranunculus cassubicifolius]